MVTHRGVTVRQRIRRLECNRTFKKWQRSAHLLGHPRVDVRLGSQDKVIGIEAFGALRLTLLISARRRLGAMAPTTDNAISS
ncbi:hypothetical protein ACTMU2_31650 [Cupriavidus basilensis]